MRAWKFSPVILMALAPFGDGALATGDRDARACLDASRSHVERLPVQSGDVTGVTIVPRLDLHREGPYLVGYEAYVRLQSCTGSLVLNLNEDCSFRDAYTRGACKIQGLPDY